MSYSIIKCNDGENCSCDGPMYVGKKPTQEFLNITDPEPKYWHLINDNELSSTYTKARTAQTASTWGEHYLNRWNVLPNNPTELDIYINNKIPNIKDKVEIRIHVCMLFPREKRIFLKKNTKHSEFFL